MLKLKLNNFYQKLNISYETNFISKKAGWFFNKWLILFSFIKKKEWFVALRITIIHPIFADCKTEKRIEKIRHEKHQSIYEWKFRNSVFGQLIYGKKNDEVKYRIMGYSFTVYWFPNSLLYARLDFVQVFWRKP